MTLRETLNLSTGLEYKHNEFLSNLIFFLTRGVSEELERMRTKEKYLNNQFTSVCADFKESKLKLEDLESKSGKANEKVTKLTNELTEINEKLEELKESFESKDSGVHDTSPLVRIKSSLQQVKAEVYAFDLRIGVVSHSLLASRVNAANSKRIHAKQKAKQRRVKGVMRKDSAADEDSLLSGDD